MSHGIKGRLAALAIVVAVITAAWCVNPTKQTLAETTIPASFTFKKNLGYGNSVYPDVNYLQYFLDQDDRTAVATSGPGSMGELTSFFGEKTRNAVGRFQELYREEILEPAGLAEPTGYFGTLTRAKANSVLSEQRSASSTASSGNDDSDGSNLGGLLGGGSMGNIGGGSGNDSGGNQGGGGGGSQNFGGSVSKVTRCTCSSSSMLDIDDVRGSQIQLIYTPGSSRLYANYNVNGTGQNVLGTYAGGGQCMVLRGEECESEGNPRGTIQMIGTSQ